MRYIFETNRLAVRPFVTTDAAFILQLLNTPSWLRYIGDRSVHSLDEAESYLLNGPLRSYQLHQFGAWLVCLKDDDQPIGMCGLFTRDFLTAPDIGFAFLPEFEGKGYAYEAVQATLSYVHDKLLLDKLYAFTQQDNQRSIGLLKKCGFIFKEMIEVPNEENKLMLYMVEV